MEHHLGRFGVIFIAATLFLFSFSTFLGILFYARCNVAYLFGDNWASQTAYKVLALVMLFIGGLAAYTFVWDLGDVGIGLMTIFNIIILYPQGEKALKELKEYEKEKNVNFQYEDKEHLIINFDLQDEKAENILKTAEQLCIGFDIDAICENVKTKLTVNISCTSYQKVGKISFKARKECYIKNSNSFLHKAEII